MLFEDDKVIRSLGNDYITKSAHKNLCVLDWTLHHLDI